jgi:hypothetical protein
MITWIDVPTWVLVEVDQIRREVCLSDGAVKRRRFYVADDAGMPPVLEPCIPGREPTPEMTAAWSRFCAWMMRTLELTAGPS